MIQLHGVHKRYRGRREQAVLHNIDLGIEAGEIVLVSGPIGAGKSTLLGLLYGAQLADAGTVAVFGRDVARLRRASLALLRRRVGVVPQTITLIEDRSALHNVALALEVCAQPRPLTRARAAESLGLVGLACDVDTRVAELSTGQKQMVALARAIVREPAILVADEPLTHLDDNGREVLIEVLSRASTRGTAAVVATNDHRLLRAGAHHGWRHCELRDGSLRVVAERTMVHDSAEETPDSDYESFEVSSEDNVVPFPLAVHAGGME